MLQLKKHSLAQESKHGLLNEMIKKRLKNMEKTSKVIVLTNYGKKNLALTLAKKQNQISESNLNSLRKLLEKNNINYVSQTFDQDEHLIFTNPNNITMDVSYNGDHHYRADYDGNRQFINCFKKKEILKVIKEFLSK